MSRELQFLIEPEATISKMEMVQSEGELKEEVVVSKMEMTTELGAIAGEALYSTEQAACEKQRWWGVSGSLQNQRGKATVNQQLTVQASSGRVRIEVKA